MQYSPSSHAKSAGSVGLASHAAMKPEVLSVISVHIPSSDVRPAVHITRAPPRNSPHAAPSFQSKLLGFAAAVVAVIFVAFILGSVLSANASTLVGEAPVSVGSGEFVTRKPCSL